MVRLIRSQFSIRFLLCMIALFAIPLAVIAYRYRTLGNQDPPLVSLLRRDYHVVYECTAGEGRFLYDDDIVGLEFTDFPSKSPPSLSVLARHATRLPNLKSLKISSRYVVDFSGASSFPTVERLELEVRGDSDLSPLSGLSNLKELVVRIQFPYGRLASDLNWLRALSKLRSLDLSGLEGLADAHLDAVGTLSELRILKLGGTDLSDISEFASLKKLRHLNLSKTRVANVSSLGGLSELVELDLSHCPVNDVRWLRGLRDLRKLDLEYTFIKDVSFLGELKNLRSLNLANTKVKDVSVIRQLKKLNTVDLREAHACNASWEFESVTKMLPSGCKLAY